jgi:membrane associated rhomboid family serine protease
MIPIRDNQISRNVPLVTWTLIALNCLIFLWDRQWHLFGDSQTFAGLVMRPNEVVAAVKRTSGDSFPLVTVFTSMFLHGNMWHLVGNMLFLLVFGINVEAALGAARYSLYYLFWGIVAAMAHIYVEPASSIPTLGASGAIGGVLGCYFLLFPGNKIEFVVPILAFISFMVSAWVVLGLWFLYQIFVPQNGVANWAHAGGFLAGMLTVLIMGGRAVVLRGKENEFELDPT